MVLIAVNNFQDNSLGAYELPEGSVIIDLKAEIEATEGIPIGHQRLLRKHDDSQDLEDNEDLDSLTSDVSLNAIVYLVPQLFYYLTALPKKNLFRRILFRLAQDAKQLTVRIINGRLPFKTRKWFIGGNEIHVQDKFDKRRDAIDNFESGMGIAVNLDEPVRAWLLWKILDRDYKIDPSTANISVLAYDGRPAFNISDLDKSFSYYGVCNGDAVLITYVPSTREDFRSRVNGRVVFTRTRIKMTGTVQPAFKCRVIDENASDWWVGHAVPVGRGKIVCAKYDWNGEIMHPTLKGLLLKHTALIAVEMSGNLSSKRHCSPGWLYGSPVSLSEVRLSGLLRRRVEGYFPENFVSPVDGVADTSAISETTEQHLDVPNTEILDIPPLPPFHFPPANRMTFRMPIGDKGHSFLKFTANYECVSSPVDPTHVTISLLCTTHDIRRISAVSVFITIPESTLQDVRVCENEAHQKEIHTDKEVTETQSKGKYFDGINIGTHGTTVGLQGGVSRSYSLGGTEKGQKISRRKVTAAIDKEDTICWNLKAPTSKLDEDGLDGEESITLVLKKKPVEFKYKCRVTHAKDGVEKTTQRITDNKPWEFFLSR